MPSSKYLPSSRLGLAGLSLLVLITLDVGAADKDPAKAAKEQVRRLQEQKRGLEMEKSQLLQEKGELAKKLEIAEEMLEKKKGLESSLLDAKRRLQSTSERVERLKEEVAELKNQVGTKNDELAKLSSQFESEKTSRGRAEKSLEACSANNETMYRQGRELLQAFSRGGACDAVSGEPFLGLGRVGRENALETARDDLDAQRYRAAERN